MTRLENWLDQARRRLSNEPVAQVVRQKIEEHYESATEAAIADGVSPDVADQAAVASLGDAKTANRQYRKVLLTDSEARTLRNLNSEPRSIPGARFGGWFLRICPVFTLGVSAVSFSRGESNLGRIFLTNAILGLLFAARTFPIYTPSRGSIISLRKVGGTATLIGFGPYLTD